MKKNTVGYCWNCADYTEQRVIECHDSALWKTFEIVVTLGFGALLEHNYNCKCKECGHINILTF